MSHILDNPVWHALNSGNKALAFGNQHVKYFSGDVSTFAGLEDPTTENFLALYDIIPPPGIVATISAAPMTVPAIWKVINQFEILQMVYGGIFLNAEDNQELVPLTEQHITAMTSLIKATNPGPFNQRTIDFGNYQGIFKSGQLIAMAGQRLHIGDYKEISAVCTHPHHTGKGYASILVLQQIRCMLALSSVPILHVKSDNEKAIKLYEKLGFYNRKELTITVLKK